MNSKQAPQDVRNSALMALNRTASHIYGGTVPPKVVASRRAANKVARASRRANRRSR